MINQGTATRNSRPGKFFDAENNKTLREDGGRAPLASVWLPFASGRVVEIELSCYPAEHGGRPVTAYPVHDVGSDLVQTVDCAAEVAYRLARENMDEAWAAYCIGYRLRDMPAEARIAGESGGLAMSLAFYSELTGTRIGRIAATGRLTSLVPGDSLGAVHGICEKLTGCLKVLSEGDTMFYPQENEDGIPQTLRDKYAKKKIHLLPVDSVEDAISHLEEEGEGVEATGMKIKKIYFPFIALALSGILIWAFTFFTTPAGKPKLETSVPLAPVKEITETHSQVQPVEKQIPRPSKDSGRFE